MALRAALLCAAGIVSALLIASTVGAQSQPGSPPRGYQPPPKNGQPGPNGGMQPQMHPPGPMWEFQPSGYPESFVTDWPATEMRAVPPALVRAVVARAHLRRAESALNRAVRDVRFAFERSKEWVAALDEERQSWEAYQAIRARALKTLQDDPSYQASMNLKQSVNTQLEDLLGDRYSSVDERIAMATVKMGYGQTATAMEAAAIAADPDVQAARQRLRNASSKISELRSQFDLSVRGSPVIFAARQTLDNARIAHLATDANFWATLNLSQVALDYSYYLHRYDKYRYLSYGAAGVPWWGSGFPNGWGGNWNTWSSGPWGQTPWGPR